MSRTRDGAVFPADAFAPDVVAAVVQLLRREWDPTGRIMRAAATAPVSKNPYDPRTIDDVAIALCGISAAGGNQLDVMGYLRREEERLFGEPVNTGHERGTVARQLWAAMGRKTKRELHEERQQSSTAE